METIFTLFAIWCVGTVVITLIIVIALHLMADNREHDHD